MMKLNYVATLLMIFIKCLMCVYSIKCYQCRSDVQDRCAELRHDEYLSDCVVRNPRRRLDTPQLRQKRILDKPQLRQKKRSDKPHRHHRRLDITQAHYKRTSSINSPYCRKISQAQCAYTHEDIDTCYRTPWKDSKVVTCDCAVDGCNRGYSKHRKKPSLVVLLCTLFSLMSWRFFLRNNHLPLRTRS